MQDAVVVSQPISFANRLLATYNELDEHMRRALKRPPETSHKRLLETMAKSNPLFEGRCMTCRRLRDRAMRSYIPNCQTGPRSPNLTKPPSSNMKRQSRGY